MIGRDRALTRKCSAGLVWGDRPLAGELPSSVVRGYRTLARELPPSLVWGYGTLTWELAAPVVRRYRSLIRKNSWRLVRGNGPLSWELSSCLIWRDGPGEVTGSGIGGYPCGSSSSILVMELGLLITFTCFGQFSLFDPFAFATFFLATGSILFFAFAMLVLLMLPIEKSTPRQLGTRRWPTILAHGHALMYRVARIVGSPENEALSIIDQSLKCSRSIVGSWADLVGWDRICGKDLCGFSWNPLDSAHNASRGLIAVCKMDRWAKTATT